MPTMANIVVKADNGTTDITWVAQVASAGDSIPARWTNDSASTIRGHRPTFELRTQSNGAKTARRSNSQAKFPVIRALDGVPTVVGYIIQDFSQICPNDVTDVEANEAVSQGTNLLAAALTRGSLKSGYAPN